MRVAFFLLLSAHTKLISLVLLFVEVIDLPVTLFGYFMYIAGNNNWFLGYWNGYSDVAYFGS